MTEKTKLIVRTVVAAIVRWTIKNACDTFGDVAELSAGPCERCVGNEVSAPHPEESADA